jgi:hypothetical protein
VTPCDLLVLCRVCWSCLCLACQARWRALRLTPCMRSEGQSKGTADSWLHVHALVMPESGRVRPGGCACLLGFTPCLARGSSWDTWQLSVAVSTGMQPGHLYCLQPGGRLSCLCSPASCSCGHVGDDGGDTCGGVCGQALRPCLCGHVPSVHAVLLLLLGA